VAGQIEVSFPSVVAVGSLVAARKLRALAVTSAKRSSLLPSLPTVSEAGLTGYDRSTFFGVVVPTGVPKDIITRLNAVLGKVVNTPEIKALLIKQGLEPQTSTPEQFASFIHAQIAQNAKLIKLVGVKTQ